MLPQNTVYNKNHPETRISCIEFVFYNIVGERNSEYEFFEFR